jgi:acyl-[acyl-carrier-protein] desaturase
VITPVVDQVQRWDIANLRVSGGDAGEAQEYLCKHSERIRRLADLQLERKLRDRKRGKSKSAAFSWIFKREVSLM